MIKTIQGGIAEDYRGHIRFVNEFDMTEVKRFYIIKNKDTELVRGWRGHKIEQRWFYVLSGSFEVEIIKIDDFNNASTKVLIDKRVLLSSNMQILHVPVGYATAFKALEADSELLVYADYGIDNATNDNYTWNYDYFQDN